IAPAGDGRDRPLRVDLSDPAIVRVCHEDIAVAVHVDARRFVYPRLGRRASVAAITAVAERRLAIATDHRMLTRVVHPADILVSGEIQGAIRPQYRRLDRIA